MKTLRFLFLLALSASLLPGLARALEHTMHVNMEPGAQAQIRYTAATNIPASHGFLPILVHIENRAREERTWDVDFTYRLYPQPNFGSSQRPSSAVLSEHFTVAASSTLERVVFVPTGGRSMPQPTLVISTLGPEVRSPIATLASMAIASPSLNYPAVTPALGDAITGMKDSKMRTVVYTGRDGGLQTRYLAPGTNGVFTLSDGTVVMVPGTGAPTISNQPSGAASVVSTKVSPLGDVTIVAPSGVFVMGSQTRLDSRPPATGAGSTSFPPSSMARTVIIQQGSMPQRTLFISQNGSGTISFSNGVDMLVPFSGPPTLSPVGSGITFTVDANDRLTITLPLGVRVQRTNIRGSGAYPTSAATPTAPQTIGSYTSIIDPAKWPADPRVWSLFSMVIMEAQEWERLDPARRGALRDWIALGGILVLSPDASSAARAVEAHGAGQIVRLEKSVKDCTQDDLMDLGLKSSVRHSMPWSSVAPQLLSNDDWASMVFSQGGGVVVFCLLVFAVVAGPVTFFKLAPAGKRHRVFIVVPILCLGTTALLALTIVLRDGIGGAGISRALVILIPEDKRAVVFQEQAARTGLILKTRFTVAPETLLVREEVPNNCRIPGSGDQWTCIREGDEARGDWFMSRSCQRHQLRQLVSSRANIELLKSANGEDLSIRSSLATTLSRFLYLDEKGIQWTATDIAPGALVKLKRDSNITGDAKLRKLFPKHELGWFYALGGSCDLAPMNTLGSIHWKDQEVLYAGRLGLGKEVAP